MLKMKKIFEGPGKKEKKNKSISLLLQQTCSRSMKNSFELCCKIESKEYIKLKTGTMCHSRDLEDHSN